MRASDAIIAAHAAAQDAEARYQQVAALLAKVKSNSERCASDVMKIEARLREARQSLRTAQRIIDDHQRGEIPQFFQDHCKPSH